MKSDHFKGAVPARLGERIVWLDGNIPVHELRAALGASGLVLYARGDVIRITLPKRVKQ